MIHTIKQYESFIMKNVIFTISSLNYLHYSLNVRKSFLQYNPNWEFVIFLMDLSLSTQATTILEKLNKDNIDIRSFLEIKNGIKDYPIEEMLLKYNVLEMNTAIKPFCLEYFYNRGYNKIIYIDPDIQFYAPISKLEQLLEENDIILTPHMMHPYPEDGKMQDCQIIMKSGLYNCGFFGMKSTKNSLSCVKFWQQKLKNKCYVDFPNALFTDQKWADWFPSLFDKVYILKDYGYNMAYWNLHERTLHKKNKQLYANNDKLVFYHFSGLNRKDMDLISKYQNRYKLSDREPELHELFLDYLTRVNSNNAEVFSQFKYFGNTVLHSDYKVPDNLRKTVFINQKAFPNSREEVEKSIQIYNDAQNILASAVEYNTGYGINIIGYLYDLHSLGIVIRSFVKKLLNASIPFSVTVIESGGKQISDQEKEKYKEFITDNSSYLTNLFFVNADQIPNIYSKHPQLFKKKYNIANWWWEFEDGFEEYADAAKYLDKIIVCSKHIQKAVSKQVKIPVELFDMPYCCNQNKLISRDIIRDKYKISEQDYTFFFNFDYNSSYDRKNPESILRAFASAFPKERCVRLVIKTSNGASYSEKVKHFFNVVSKLKLDKKITIIDAFLSDIEMMSLINACDAYISLHHAEGFGLGLCEAMDLGKPVIASKYSGNLAFMDDNNSFLVNVKKEKIHIDFPQYKTVNIWGTPDEKLAAQYMRDLYKHPEKGIKKGELAAISIHQKFSMRNFKSNFYNLIRDCIKQEKFKIYPAPFVNENLGISIAKYRCNVKLFNFLPIFSYKCVGGRNQWKIFGLPIFKTRHMANGITSKYYILGIPVLKVSKKSVK